MRTDEHLASPRGKIDIQRIANQAGTLQATLPCTYHPRLEDCLVNQVLLQGLLLATRLTNNSTLRIQSVSFSIFAARECVLHQAGSSDV